MQLGKQATDIQKNVAPSNGQNIPSMLRNFGILYIFAAICLDLQFFHGAPANILVGVVLAALILYRLPIFSTRLLSQDWAYVAYLCIIFFSAVWSLDPEATLEQAVPMIIPWLATLGLSAIPADWAVRVLVKISIGVCILSLLLIFASQKIAFQPRSSTGEPELRGIFGHQLYLGSFLVLVLGLIAVAALNGHLNRILGDSFIVKVAIILLILAVLYLSRTRLYVAAGVIALALTWLVSRRGSKKWVAANMLILVGGMGAWGFSGIIGWLNEEGVDTTLTGRTYVWERTLSAISSDTDLLGYGFGTFQLPTFDHLFTQFRPTHAHNAFIQAYFEIGRVGLFIVIALAAVQVVAAWRSSVRLNAYSYSLFLVLFCIFGGLSGGTMYAGVLVTTFCLMLLFLSIETRIHIDDVPPGRNGQQLTMRRHESARIQEKSGNPTYLIKQRKWK